MYVPKYHQQNDQEAIYGLIERHPLGTWVCQVGGALVANHIPFVLDRSKGAHGTLIGHVSRANQVWRSLAEGATSVVTFQGPQAYISPGWYPTKQEHGKVVPTWDYTVTHAHGIAHAVEDPKWLLDMLNRLTNAQEASREQPWHVADAPDSYIEKMLRAIVGIEIPILSLEGKLKVSQDEALPDRQGTVAALERSTSEVDRALAVLVKNAIVDGR
ncbi:MAG: FMN-binding negative transcriptional regulator [Hydrogenophaga sp.]|uniref:FMN-binding negative transcriptional regulator n=1 Tax=Hydrogenophaga sp. TaxID=1904254 RepID=UPI004035F79D